MKRKLFLSLIMLCILFSVAGPVGAKAAGPLDEIQKITIDAGTSSDGIVTLEYTVYWKVLDSTSEGPLSWVQIGVPNNSYEIADCYGDAASVVPYNSNGESKVRVNLHRDFKAGEIASFSFSIRQYNLLQPLEGGYRCDYVPGWFDEIEVKSLMVKWHTENVTKANGEKIDNVYVWEGPLKAGEHFQTVTTYYGNDITPAAFSGGESQEGGSSDSISFLPVLLIFGPVVFILILIIKNGPYNGGTGFGGGYRGGYHGGYRGGCACACAGCACACACAGGGRAGCAKKDFTSFNEDHSNKPFGESPK